MKAKKFGQKILAIFTVLSLFALSLAMVYAANNVEPSKPSGYTPVANSTNAYPNASSWNFTRGYIHTVNIEEKAPTLKWIAFVGNITGSFALQDSDGYSIYDWDITTTRGEVYATKEGPLPIGGTPDTVAGDGSDNVESGGIPEWENIQCANAANITAEEMLMNHTRTYGARANEDAYTNTFISSASSFSLNEPFYVGESVWIGTSGTGPNGESSQTCYGAHLNVNDTDQSTDWEQIVLMDGTFETEEGGRNEYDLIYASLIENDTYGYRNDSTTYDFQMLLPQSGLEGGQPNVPFYFYVELV